MPTLDAYVELKEDRKLGYNEYGDPQGKPVFYFHDTPGSRLEAERFHEIASTHGYWLIAIDRPGMGLSPFFKKHTLLSWATDIAGVADALNISKFSILGYSGGGVFAAACACTIPERLKGVALVSTMAPPTHPETKVSWSPAQRRGYFLLKFVPRWSIFMMKVVQLLVQKPQLFDFFILGLSAKDQALLQDPMIKNNMMNSMREAFKNGAQGPAHEMKLLARSWRFDITQIQCPIAIWQGEGDKQVPEAQAHIYANAITKARLKIILGEGHISVLDKCVVDILKSVCPN